PLALAGWRLAKRTSSGALASCELVPAAGEAWVAPGGAALVTGGAWDGRYDLPAGLPRFACGASALAGGLADDRPPEVRLVDPDGAVQATFGEGGVAPRCPAAVERVVPAGPDEAANLACAVGEGTPGRCNSVTACP
ncbi:MAG TPA: lamin tail domain-containing protein, partial [Anaeromyxobacteraceae bacterium]|nr:lamin tail domain-containing protein [Anaeromyxobacteraceae bacterium]